MMMNARPSPVPKVRHAVLRCPQTAAPQGSVFRPAFRFRSDLHPREARLSRSLFGCAAGPEALQVVPDYPSEFLPASHGEEMKSA